MPYRKTNPYPFTDDDVVRRLRRKRKEDLVAIVCYLAKRLEITEGAMKELIPTVIQNPVHPDFFERFKDIINTVFGSTMHLMKRYVRFIDGLEAPQVVTFQVAQDECEECSGACEDEPEHDPSDVTVQ